MKKLLLLFFIPTLFTFSQNAKADMAGKYIGTLDVRLCNETEDGSTPDYTEGIELPKMSNVEVYVESQNDGKYTFILKDFAMEMGGGVAVAVGDISVPNIEFIDTTDENNMIFTSPETILDKTTGDVPLGYLPTYIDKSYFINKSKINSTIWTKWAPSEDSSIPIYINFEGDKDPTYTSIVDYSIDDILTISSEFITFRTNSQFVIYGVAGNVVKQGENTIVSLDGFNKGVYILSVQTANGVVSKKFSVK